MEKYYGRGKMITVVGKLLEECDRVVTKLMKGWEEERSLTRKVVLFLFLLFLRLIPWLLTF